MPQSQEAWPGWIGGDKFSGTGDVNGNGRLDAGETARQTLGNAWDHVILGGVHLPGVSTIVDFGTGTEIDVQKNKSKDGAKAKDCGKFLSRFSIKVEITSAEWPAWLVAYAGLEQIKTRQTQEAKDKGREPRPAFSIGHPLPNSHNVTTVFIERFDFDPPSARTGMVITIKLVEFFAEQAELKAVGRGKPKVRHSPPDYMGKPQVLADKLSARQGNPASQESVMERVFGAPPPPEPLPGEIGWHGFKSNQAPGAPPKATGLGFNPLRRGP